MDMYTGGARVGIKVCKLKFNFLLLAYYNNKKLANLLYNNLLEGK